MTSLASAPGRRRAARGFTLLEMTVVVAIILVSAAMVLWGFGAQKERTRLNASFLELRGLFAQARNHALATGNRVVVMVFPTQGRFIIYEDGNGTFFRDDAPVNFDDYAPFTLRADTRSDVVDTADLPNLVSVGPADGWGTDAEAPAPHSGISLAGACTFCAGDRGAVAFDPPRGNASFYGANGAPLGVTGGSLSLTAQNTTEVKTLVIGGNGAFRPLSRY